MEASDWNETSELKYLTHWMPLPPLPGSAARDPAGSVAEPAVDAYALLQEVAACFTCDDDLPANLLPRIDAALAARKQGENHD